MRKLTIGIAILALCVLSSAFGDELGGDRPTMQSVSDALVEQDAPQVFRDIWAQCLALDKDFFNKCDVAFDKEKGSLAISHSLRKFQVHAMLMNGTYSEKPETVVGPSADGVRISIYVRNGKYAGNALLPQDIRKSYWHQYVNAYDGKGGKRHIVLSVEYGQKQRKLKGEIIKKMAGVLRDR